MLFQPHQIEKLVKKMGCCQNAYENPGLSKISEQIKACIKKGNLKQLSFFLATLAQLLKNRSEMITFQIKLTTKESIDILGYALLLGKLEVFKFLLEKLDFDVVQMEKNLQSIGQTGLSIICENNYIDLFEYYAPIYINSSELFQNHKKSRQNPRFLNENHGK